MELKDLNNIRVVLTTEERDFVKHILSLNSETIINGHSTLCQHIRLLYRLVQTEEEKALCEEIIFLARKMNDKLREYKNKENDSTT